MSMNRTAAESLIGARRADPYVRDEPTALNDDGKKKLGAMKPPGPPGPPPPPPSPSSQAVKARTRARPSASPAPATPPAPPESAIAVAAQPMVAAAVTPRPRWPQPPMPAPHPLQAPQQPARQHVALAPPPPSAHRPASRSAATFTTRPGGAGAGVKWFVVVGAVFAGVGWWRLEQSGQVAPIGPAATSVAAAVSGSSPAASTVRPLPSNVVAAASVAPSSPSSRPSASAPMEEVNSPILGRYRSPILQASPFQNERPSGPGSALAGAPMLPAEAVAPDHALPPSYGAAPNAVVTPAWRIAGAMVAAPPASTIAPPSPSPSPSPYELAAPARVPPIPPVHLRPRPRPAPVDAHGIMAAAAGESQRTRRNDLSPSLDKASEKLESLLRKPIREEGQ